MNAPYTSECIAFWRCPGIKYPIGIYWFCWSWTKKNNTFNIHIRCQCGMTGLERSWLGNGSNTQTYHPSPAANPLGARPAVKCLVYCTSLESGMHAGSWNRILQARSFQIQRKLTADCTQTSIPRGRIIEWPTKEELRTRIFLLSRCHWKHWNHIHDWTLDQNSVPCYEKGLGTLHGYVLGQILHHYHHHGHVLQHDHHCASIPFASHEVPW